MKASRWQRATAATTVALVSVGLPGCGSASPGLSAQAAQQLQAQVQAITAAAKAGNPAGAATALDRLRAEVAQLRSAGQISASRSTAILTAASEVAGQLGSIPTTTTSTSTTTTTTTTAPPAPAPPAPAPPAKHGAGEDHGGMGDGGGH